MKTVIIFLILFSIAECSLAADFYTKKQALKIVINTLKDKEVELVESIDVTDLLGKLTPVVIYRFRRVKGVDFYAVFTQTMGRYEMFDYLVITNMKFVIEKIKVTKYRSEYGGEIGSKKWLEQFYGYSSGELRYKKEISALSGATISANSIVKDIPKVLKILYNSCN